jgi:hypothetical protein
LGSFFKVTEVTQILRATFIYCRGYELILAENGSGFILGNYFENSSGHPDPQEGDEKRINLLLSKRINLFLSKRMKMLLSKRINLFLSDEKIRDGLGQVFHLFAEQTLNHNYEWIKT